MATDYKIIKDRKISELEKEVLGSLVDGWAPIGGVATLIDDGECYLVQAMVK